MARQREYAEWIGLPREVAAEAGVSLRLVHYFGTAAAGFICLSYGVYGWAAFFLVLGALSIVGGCWELTVARSASART